MNEAGTLHGLGFTDTEARKLHTLREWYQRAELDTELTLTELQRLEFIRWLVAHGRLGH
jgi:hypothetical protein